MKNHNIRLIGELSTLVLAIFLINLGFIFLGTLIIVGILSDILLYFGVRNNSNFKNNLSSIYKKAGYYSYLVSLGYIVLIIILFQFKLFSAGLALYIIFFGVILIFPLITLFIKKPS